MTLQEARIFYGILFDVLVALVNQGAADGLVQFTGLIRQESGH